MKKGSHIIDLLGRKFKVGRWDFAPIPLLNIPADYFPCLTRDRQTGISLTLFYPEDKSHYIMQIYNSELKIYVRYELEFIKYLPEYDMRKTRK